MSYNPEEINKVENKINDEYISENAVRIFCEVCNYEGPVSLPKESEKKDDEKQDNDTGKDLVTVHCPKCGAVQRVAPSLELDTPLNG